MTNKYCLIAKIMHHWKVYFIKKGETVSARHKKSICFKRGSYQYLLGDCVYGCNFIFKMVHFLTENKTHCLLLILCYVMPFINL